MGSQQLPPIKVRILHSLKINILEIPHLWSLAAFISDRQLSFSGHFVLLFLRSPTAHCALGLL